jgi:hypothetical protein
MAEYRLRVFEKGVLRRIFGPKRDEIKVGCRKLRNEELHNFSNRSLKVAVQGPDFMAHPLHNFITCAF